MGVLFDCEIDVYVTFRPEICDFSFLSELGYRNKFALIESRVVAIALVEFRKMMKPDIYCQIPSIF